MKKITLFTALALTLCAKVDGQTWTAQYSGTMSDLEGIAFIPGTNTAIICGRTSTLLKTTNGSTWSSLTAGLGADFFDISHVESGGNNYFWSCGSNGTIIQSTNEGSSWTAQSQGAPFIIYTIDARNDTYVSATGDSYIVQTSNGGSSWNPNPNPGFTNDIQYIVGSTNMIQVGSNGRIDRSIDGGTTWANIPTSTSATLYGIHFIDANNGWVCGSAGTILKTSDNGLSWTALTTPITTDLRAIYFVDANNGFACGDYGKVLQTTNGGTSWIEYDNTQTGTSARFHDLYFSSPTEGWVVGEVGNILKFDGSTANLESQAELSLSIYPNPTSDKLTISTKAVVEFIEVLSIDGKRLLESKENTIDLSNFANGVYLVHIYADGQLYEKRVVKK